MTGYVASIAALPLAAMLLAAAGPLNSFSMATPMPDMRLASPASPARPAAPPGVVFDAAPTPNSDASAPRAKASDDASLAPGFFSRHDQYRGEGLSSYNSAQVEQDRKVKPGAGINLRMPLQ